MNHLDQMRTLREQGQPFVTATVVRVEKPTSAKPGAKAIITQDGTLTGWVGGSCVEPTVKREAARALQDGLPRLLRLCPPEKMDIGPQDGVNEIKLACISGGTLEIFLEPHLTQPHLVVVGHHAIVEALVTLAKTLEYTVTVIGEGAVPERFPAADRVIGELDFSRIAVTPNTYIVIASHGNYDELALEALLPKKPRYIALVASKKRSANIVDYLRQAGMPEETLAALKYPAGLDFGAATPPEIALSILAEIIQHSRRGTREPPAAAADRGKEAAEAQEPALAVDPICNMTVEIESARYTSVYDGETYYFCSAHCQRRFEQEPAAYVKQAEAGSA